MIDTDKYEGHNDAPWRTAEGQPYDDEGSHLDIVDANGVLVTETSYFTDNDHPNARLIADAPLLLEEVKRLRKELNQTRECLWWCYDKERFGWEVDEENWNFIGNLLGADMESEEE